MYNIILYISAQSSVANVWIQIGSVLTVLVCFGTLLMIFNNKFVSKEVFNEMKASNTRSHAEIRSENDKYLNLLKEQLREHFDMLQSIQNSVKKK